MHSTTTVLASGFRAEVRSPAPTRRAALDGARSSRSILSRLRGARSVVSDAPSVPRRELPVPFC
jgi:hypothetical protein